jgi:hypothetical protein
VVFFEASAAATCGPIIAYDLIDLLNAAPGMLNQRHSIGNSTVGA